MQRIPPPSNGANGSPRSAHPIVRAIDGVTPIRPKAGPRLAVRLLPLVLAALSATATLPATAQTILRYPGPVCPTTLRDCLDRALPTDVVEIATNETIVEVLFFNRTVTLRAAPGFEPTIVGSNGDVGILNQAFEGPQTIHLEGLRFLNSVLIGTVVEGTGHVIRLIDNDFVGTEDGRPAVSIQSRVENLAVVIAGNRIGSADRGIRLSAVGSRLQAAVERNALTLLPSSSDESAGIEVEVKRSASGFVRILGNQIGTLVAEPGDLGFGVRVTTSDSTFEATVSSNTVYGISDGIALAADQDATLTARLFNNIVSHAEHAYFLDVVETATLDLVADANHAFTSPSLVPDLPGRVFTMNPRFVDAAGGDLRLRPDSPLIDRGNSSPTGGLTALDLLGGPRVSGPAVDLGAHESSWIFGDGFESGDVRAWNEPR